MRSFGYNLVELLVVGVAIAAAPLSYMDTCVGVSERIVSPGESWGSLSVPTHVYDLHDLRLAW